MGRSASEEEKDEWQQETTDEAGNSTAQPRMESWLTKGHLW